MPERLLYHKMVVFFMSAGLQRVPIHYQNVKGIRSELYRGYTAWARDALRGEIIESTACFNRFSEMKLNLPMVEIVSFSDANRIGQYLRPNTILLSSNLLSGYLTLRGTYGPNDGGFGLKVSEVIAHENVHRFRALNNLDKRMSTPQGMFLSRQIEEYTAVLGSLSYIIMYGYGNYLEEVKESTKTANRLYSPSTGTMNDAIYPAAYSLSLSICLRKDFDPERELNALLRSDMIDILKGVVNYLGSSEIESGVNRILRLESTASRKR